MLDIRPRLKAGSRFNEIARRKRPGFRRKYFHSGKFYGIEPTAYSPGLTISPQADTTCPVACGEFNIEKKGVFSTQDCRYPFLVSSS